MHAHRLLNIVNLCRRLGIEPDPWQLDVLRGEHARLLLNCSRQAGKSTVAALLALVNAMVLHHATILLLSRSQRQSAELFRKIAEACRRLAAPNVKRLTSFELEMTHGSRIISLPCSADTIRGYSAVDMLVIDEAARVPDELYRTVRPMLAVSQGRLMCLSTPNGKRGFFWEAWAHGGDDWQRIEIPASQVSRITPEFLAEERRNLGAAWFRQEYECSFEAQEGLVYPEFAKQVAPAAGVTAPAVSAEGGRVGGIDFGFRNPFAAVWGHRDRDGVLWLTGEHYAREQPLSYHAQHLPRDVMWYADPAGANESAELRCGGFLVRKGNNDLRLGIMAVTARLQNGLLKVVPGACPNLLKEAALYRWGEHGSAETPEDADNHALAAIRYLVARLDAHKLVRMGRERALAPAAAVSAGRPVLSPQS